MAKQIEANPRLVSSALRQQGLIHLYKNFCAARDASCVLLASNAFRR